MVAYKDVKSTPANWKKIKDFASGKFDVEEMVVFLVAMAPIFKDKPPFTPDQAVSQYNRANYRDTLTLDLNTINYDPNPQGSHRKRIRDTTPSANRANTRGNGGRGRSNQNGRSGGRGRGTGHNQRRNRGSPTSLLTMRTKVSPHLGCTNPT